MHEASEASRTDEFWDQIFGNLIEAGVIPFGAGFDDVVEAERRGDLGRYAGIRNAAHRAAAERLTGPPGMLVEIVANPDVAYHPCSD